MSSSTTLTAELAAGREPDATGPLVPPPRLRRRPALVAAGVVLVCLGALLAGWAWTATTSTHEVLVARTTIERGAVIEADDLTRVQVSSDPAVTPLPGSDLERVVGQRAAVDIAGGTLLTPDSVTSAVVPGSGRSVVGLALTPGQAPGGPLKPGDRVRVVVTPAQGDVPAGGAPQFSEAEVVAVRVSEETGQQIVDLLVSHGEAAVLATQIATGNVALVLDSRER